MPGGAFSEEREYYALLDTVNAYDGRAVTVKGWSVTLSLAALGSGFQFHHAGLFLVSCISGLGFWIIDGQMKRHQMRYYARMREIEVTSWSASGSTAPQIDWSWELAPRYYRSADLGSGPEPPPPPQRYRGMRAYTYAWGLAHVALPHALGVVAGLTFFILARTGIFGAEFPW